MVTPLLILKYCVIQTVFLNPCFIYKYSDETLCYPWNLLSCPPPTTSNGKCKFYTCKLPKSIPVTKNINPLVSAFFPLDDETTVGIEPSFPTTGLTTSDVQPSKTTTLTAAATSTTTEEQTTVTLHTKTVTLTPPLTTSFVYITGEPITVTQTRTETLTFTTPLEVPVTVTIKVNPKIPIETITVTKTAPPTTIHETKLTDFHHTSVIHQTTFLSHSAPSHQLDQPKGASVIDLLPTIQRGGGFFLNMAHNISCHDGRICEVEMVFKPVCTLFDGPLPCFFPCSMAGCREIVDYNILCPVAKCSDKPEITGYVLWLIAPLCLAIAIGGAALLLSLLIRRARVATQNEETRPIIIYEGRTETYRTTIPLSGPAILNLQQDDNIEYGHFADIANLDPVEGASGGASSTPKPKKDKGRGKKSRETIEMVKADNLQYTPLQQHDNSEQQQQQQQQGFTFRQGLALVKSVFNK